MDASPDALAETVRAKRVAIDNNLELLRVRVQQAPRRLELSTWATRALPVAGGTAALWLWSRRRRRLSSLDELLAHGLTDLYRGEHQLLRALDRMRARASSPELERAFSQHRVATEGHIERLERVFRSVGVTPKRGEFAGIAAIVADGEHLAARRADPDVRDAWLIATAQRLAHLEIANYGTARAYADTLGYTFAAQLLQLTLDEERAADAQLTGLAERFVNPQSIRSAPRR
jgi:ferritin-like metal-binding protein YciE